MKFCPAFFIAQIDKIKKKYIRTSNRLCHYPQPLLSYPRGFIPQRKEAGFRFCREKRCYMVSHVVAVGQVPAGTPLSEKGRRRQNAGLCHNLLRLELIFFVPNFENFFDLKTHRYVKKSDKIKAIKAQKKGKLRLLSSKGANLKFFKENKTPLNDVPIKDPAPSAKPIVPITCPF